MDDSRHRENGRNKPPQCQGFVQHQPAMKQIMAFMAEKDAAIQERNLAVSGKKAALAERDVAILQRDSAIVKHNNAMIERDKAIATLQYQENAMNGGNVSHCSSGCQISHGMKHIPHLQQHVHHSHKSEAPFDTGDTHVNDTIPLSPIASEHAKSHGTKRAKKAKVVTSTRKTTKSSKLNGKMRTLTENCLKSHMGKVGPIGHSEGKSQIGRNRTLD